MTPELATPSANNTTCTLRQRGDVQPRQIQRASTLSTQRNELPSVIKGAVEFLNLFGDLLPVQHFLLFDFQKFFSLWSNCFPSTVGDRFHINSWLTFHEFEPGIAGDPPCRGDRCALNMLRIKRPTIGEVGKLGEADASSRVVLVT
ncbi:hypothetical protein TNCV_2062061 [Trichonephila clavipes]|nr:hypothetical protein TNCV_2062061 [Trichonephila clavipes]